MDSAAREKLAFTRQWLDGATEEAAQASQQLDQKRENLRAGVLKYTSQRCVLFEEELANRDLGWCSICNTVVPADDIAFIFEEGRRKHRGGYQRSLYGFEDFSTLNHACSACRERAMERHGSSGPYDTVAQDQERFSVFLAEKRDDGYYVNKSGVWTKLTPEQSSLKAPPEHLITTTVATWDFPPHIGLRDHVHPEEGLSITESPVPAAAS